MKNYFILLVSFLFFCSCNKVGRTVGAEVKKATEKVAVNQVLQLTEKNLGKALCKAISVLPKESQKYLSEILYKNPKLLAFFKEHPTFISTWDYLRKYLPDDCLNPEFLSMLVHANKYASYAGNKLENFVFEKMKDGTILVMTKEGKVVLGKIKPGRIVEVIGDDVNNWFLQLKPFANTKYIINDAEYLTDDMGRVISSKVNLNKSNLGTAKFRDSNVQKQMAQLKGSLQGDDAGHLIANQFGGSTNMVNLVPMKSEVNKSTLKSLENKWRSLLEEGKEVKVDIKLKYPTHPVGCERPDWIEIIYEVDGKKTPALIKNI